jgi:hypothetical protein
VLATAADREATGLDALATAADRVQTGLDRAATGADVLATAADREATGLDALATAADRVQTGLDRAATGADVLATGADREATGLDALATAADRVQTGLDAASAALAASGAAASVVAHVAAPDPHPLQQAQIIGLLLAAIDLAGAAASACHGGRAFFAGGSAAEPAVRIGSAGLYSSATDTLSVAIAGVERLRVTAAGITVYGAVTTVP